MWKKFTPNLVANQDEIVCTGAGKRLQMPRIKVSAASRASHTASWPGATLHRMNLPGMRFAARQKVWFWVRRGESVA